MPALYGRVASVSGQATIRREGREGWRPALVADDLHAGDVVKTGPDGSLVAQFGDGSSLELAGETEVALGQPSGAARRPGKAALARGDVVASIEPGGGDFELATPLAIAAVRGTKFALQSTDRKAVLTVLDGKVEFRNDVGSVLAAAMERSVVVPGHAPTDPHRLAGRMPGGIYVGKWHLHHGEYLYVDTIAHTTPEAHALLEQLRTLPETPELLEAARGALWSRGGGITLSLECAREVAGRPGRLTDLRRADLGTVHPLTVEEGTVGVPIFELVEGSPAEAAGLRRGDAIVAIDGDQVATETDLICQLWRTDPGTDVQVAFVRGGERQTATVTTAAAKPGPQELALLAALRLLQTDPEHFSAQIVVANALACAGRLAEARTAYEALPSQHLTDPVVLNNLGVLAAVEGRLGDALAQYGKAAELSPEFEGAWLNIAKVYGRSGMDAVELGLLERLVAEHPEWETASAKLARTLVRHDRGAEKLTTIEALANRHPESAELAAYQVRALQAAGQPEQAAAACARALAMESSFGVTEALAEYLLERADGPAGVDALVSQWAAYRNPWTYVHLGSAAALEQGVQLDPLNSTGHTGYIWKFLGDRHMKAKRYPEAEDCFLKAAKLEPEWAMPWQGAADAAESVGAPARPWHHRAEAVRIGTRHGAAHQENLEVALRNAVALARHAALEGDGSAQERSIRAGEEAAEMAERLASETAPAMYLSLASDFYQPRNDWDAAKRAYAKALDLDCTRRASTVIAAALEARLDGAEEASLDLLTLLLGREPELLSAADRQSLLNGLRHTTGEIGHWAWGDQGRDQKLREALDRWAPLGDALEDASLVHAAVALVHQQAGAPEEAIAECEAARSGAAADLHEFWGIWSGALRSAGRLEESTAAGVEAIRRWPADAYEPWGLRYRLPLADPMAGVEAIRARMAEEETHVSWYGALGDLLEAAGDIDEAEVALKEHTRLAPHEGGGVLAWFYLRQNRLEDAEAASRRHLSACPPGQWGHAWAEATLAEVLGFEQKWEEAMEHACLALEALPHETPNRYYRIVKPSVGSMQNALRNGAGTTVPAARTRGALLAALRSISAGLVIELDEATTSIMLDLMSQVGAEGDRQERTEFWLAVLDTRGRAPVLTKGRITAAAALAELAPSKARERLHNALAEAPDSEWVHLALWSATKDYEPGAAIQAALAAVSCAEGDGNREAYTEVAEFLAAAGPETGLGAFAARLDATGGITGPLGLGYMVLLLAAEESEKLPALVDAILASSDDALAEDAACTLSSAGRHAEAVALMEHAIRLHPSALGANHYHPAPRVFADAGQMPRLVELYDQMTRQHPDDGGVVMAAAVAMRGAGDRDRAKHWLEQLPPGNAWVARQWANWYESEGMLDDARRAWEQAQTRGLGGPSAGFERIEILGEATAPVHEAMLVYVGYDLQQGFALCDAAGAAAVEAGRAGRPWMGVAAALRTLADRDPERMVQGARRAAEDYPDNLAAMVALAVIGTGIQTEGLDDPSAVARAALAAVDGVDPDLTPCVYTVCGEILLREGWREEAADAFRRAIEDPFMAPEWQARAEAGLQAASEPGDTE